MSTIEIGPQPGPQTQFLETKADICFYGGQAGGGKSYALLLDHLRWTNTEGYAGVIFRRTSPELEGAGSIWEEASGLYPSFGARLRSGGSKLARFPNGSMVEFRHLQLEKDKLSHQSKQYAVISFDEVTHFTESQFWFFISRNRSVCGVKPYIRGTCNPSAESWVREFIDWWINPESGLAIPERSGQLRWMSRNPEDDTITWGNSREELIAAGHPKPLSVTFINSTLADNPALTAKDPEYEERLQQMPRRDRERLAGGNWNIRDNDDVEWPADYFQRTMVEDRPHKDEIQFTAMSLDPSLGRTEKADYSAIIIGDLTRDGTIYLTCDIKRRDISTIVDDTLALYREVEPEVLSIEVNGFLALKELFQKTAGTETLRLASVTQHKNKIARIKIGIGPLLQLRRLRFVEGPSTATLLGQLRGFPLSKHDDGPDAVEQVIRVIQSVLAGENKQEPPAGRIVS